MALSDPVQPSSQSMQHGQARSVDMKRVQGGGHDRFGPIGDLAVFRDEARDLALAYARTLGLTTEDFLNDPDVTVCCIGLALARQEEMLLQQQIQRDLSERADLAGGDYGKAMFNATKNETYARHQKSIDRMHIRASRYREELEYLVRRRGAARTATDAASGAASASCPDSE